MAISPRLAISSLVTLMGFPVAVLVVGKSAECQRLRVCWRGLATGNRRDSPSLRVDHRPVVADPPRMKPGRPGVEKTPPPLEGGGWGEGLAGANLRSTPPPNPLPQGEGEPSCFLLGAQRRSKSPPDHPPYAAVPWNQSYPLRSCPESVQWKTRAIAFDAEMHRRKTRGYREMRGDERNAGGTFGWYINRKGRRGAERAEKVVLQHSCFPHPPEFGLVAVGELCVSSAFAINIPAACATCVA
jgi:hypothetical protein